MLVYNNQLGGGAGASPSSVCFLAREVRLRNRAGKGLARTIFCEAVSGSNVLVGLEGVGVDY